MIIEDVDLKQALMEFPPFDAWRGIPRERRPPASLHDAVQRSFDTAKERHVAQLARRFHEMLRLGQRYSAQEGIHHNPTANIYDLRGLVLIAQS